MKVNSQRDISFKSVYTNRAVKNGLEFAADYGALFAATAAAGFSVVRPLAIWMTPKTEKENRILAISKSLMSSAVGLLMTMCLALPLGYAIKKINKNPEKFLNKESIKKYFCSERGSKSYEFGTQLFKLGLGTLIAVPKSIMVAAGVPYVANSIEKKDRNSSKDSSISFKANSTKGLAKQIGKILNKKWFQRFTDKNKDTNFPMHIVALTDTVATAAFIYQIGNNHNIDEARKKPLMYNAGISTALSIAGGYILDKLLDKPTRNFIEKYKSINKNDTNLAKQIQGIKISKPILILGSIYYILIPLISTFLAERANKNNKRQIFKNL